MRALGPASDERRARGQQRRPLAWRLGSDLEQRFVRGAGRGRGLDAQLAHERGRAGVVRPQRPRPVAGGIVEGDQTPIGLLAQRVVAQQALRIADCLSQPPPLLELLDEPLERFAVELCEPFTLLEQPLVVVALQQLAPVRLDCVLEPALRDRLLEGGDIQPQPCIRAQLQRARPGVDEPIRLGQRPA